MYVDGNTLHLSQVAIAVSTAATPDTRPVQLIGKFIVLRNLKLSLSRIILENAFLVTNEV